MCISLFTDPLFSLQSLSSTRDRKQKHWGIYWPLHTLTRCVFSERIKNKKKNKTTSMYRLCVYGRIFVSAIEFCHISKLHKIKTDRICATCRRDKIMLLRQRFPQNYPVHMKWFEAASCHTTCCSNKSPSLYTCSDLSLQHVVVTFYLVRSNCYDNY